MAVLVVHPKEAISTVVVVAMVRRAATKVALRTVVADLRALACAAHESAWADALLRIPCAGRARPACSRWNRGVDDRRRDKWRRGRGGGGANVGVCRAADEAVGRTAVEGADAGERAAVVVEALRAVARFGGLLPRDAADEAAGAVGFGLKVGHAWALCGTPLGENQHSASDREDAGADGSGSEEMHYN